MDWPGVRFGGLAMNLMAWATLFAVALCVASVAAPPEAPLPEPTVVRVWPGVAAGDLPEAIGPERWRDPRPGDKWQKWVTNVTVPTLTVYPAPAATATGAAAIICPGGGYHDLMWDLEGEEVAAWLNSIGVTGIILKYRCPRRPGDPLGVPAPGPLKDSQRAVSLVRSRAAEWKLDPNRIGMIGFSAGAHLVGSTATNFGHRSYDRVDAVDEVSCRPDFGIMAYSGYFWQLDKKQLTPTVRVLKDAPPLFFVHASDDPVRGAEVQNSLQFYLALREVGALPELHLFDRGGHGFGVRQDGNPCQSWIKSCASWLERHGMLKRPAPGG